MCKFVFVSCFRTPAVKKKSKKNLIFLNFFRGGWGHQEQFQYIYIQRQLRYNATKCLRYVHASIYQFSKMWHHSSTRSHKHHMTLSWVDILQHSTRFQNQANVIGENNRVLRVQRVPHFDFGLTCDRELGFCLGNGFYHASACSQKDCYQQYPRQRCLDRKSKKKMTTDGLETDKSHSRMKG